MIGSKTKQGKSAAGLRINTQSAFECHVDIFTGAHITNPYHRHKNFKLCE